MILKAMNKHASKSSMYHATWCLAVQQAISPAGLTRHFPSLIESLLGVLRHTLDNKDLEVIDQEALQVRLSASTAISSAVTKSTVIVLDQAVRLLRRADG